MSAIGIRCLKSLLSARDYAQALRMVFARGDVVRKLLIGTTGMLVDGATLDAGVVVRAADVTGTAEALLAKLIPLALVRGGEGFTLKVLLVYL
jgi:hypothetical protein